MIKILKEEYVKNKKAIRGVTVTFLNIPIYKSEETSTNTKIVEQFSENKERIKIKGFKNETKN